MTSPTSESIPLPPLTHLWQETLGWQPDAAQQEQFQRLYRLILEGNRQFNLTRITEPQEFWEKHLWDSLRGIGLELLGDRTPALKVIDIGTGAGFPGVPLAIVRPDWEFTLLDSTRKKVTFLEHLTLALGLTHVSPIPERAETSAHRPEHRASYDLALIRAVAAAPVCAEYAIPHVKEGGRCILYRGQWTDAEAIELEAALRQLGAVVDLVDAFTTPLTQGIRHCIHLKKTAPTPDRFPRAVGVPTQRSLSSEASHVL